MADPKAAPIPPQNLDAEESVLGAMMLSAAAIDACSDVLAAPDFYRASHGVIFDACLALHAQGEPVDAITVADRLDALDKLAEVGGKERIHEIASLVPATSNASHYAGIVREMAVLRELITAGEVVQRLGWDRPGPTPELLAEAERAVFALTKQRARGEFVTSEEVAHELIRRLDELSRSGREIVGLPTGFREIDRMTSGLHPGNLVVIAGRPSMGKSGFAFGVAANVALSGLPVALFTFEMSRYEVMQRLLSLDALVPSDHLNSPSRLTGEDWKRVYASSTRLAAAPLFIEDSRSLTMMDVRSQARRLKARHPALALIIVDYIQLMESGASRFESRNLEVGQISRSLKLMAGELDVPVIALSQLGRDVEKRHDRRPILSDLRDSGAIEQDADVVLLLYRGAYYFPEDEELQGIAEVDVAKQRNGPTGMRKHSFVERYAKFSDMPRPGTGGVPSGG